MIEMHNIVKVFKNGNIEVRALDAVSLNIKKGEFVAITGTSGSGKSTLMNIIGCIDTPTEGATIWMVRMRWAIRKMNWLPSATGR